MTIKDILDAYNEYNMEYTIYKETQYDNNNKQN